MDVGPQTPRRLPHPLIQLPAPHLHGRGRERRWGVLGRLGSAGVAAKSKRLPGRGASESRLVWCTRGPCSLERRAGAEIPAAPVPAGWASVSPGTPSCLHVLVCGAGETDEHLVPGTGSGALPCSSRQSWWCRHCWWLPRDPRVRVQSHHLTTSSHAQVQLLKEVTLIGPALVSARP